MFYIKLAGFMFEIASIFRLLDVVMVFDEFCFNIIVDLGLTLKIITPVSQVCAEGPL